MRVLLVVSLLAVLAGCAHPVPPVAPPPPPPPACGDEPAQVYTYYLAPGMTLNTSVPAAGAVAGNGFREAFLSNDLMTWQSDGAPQGLLIEGNVTLDVWIDVAGQVAPPDQSDPAHAYTFLNQFGSNRAFQTGYGREVAPVGSVAGRVHLNETLAMPKGGFTIEQGDRIRLLITSLIVDDGNKPGTMVLFGNGTPSHVRFAAKCVPVVDWQIQRYLRQPVVVLASQGGPLHLPAADCGTIGADQGCPNRYEYPFMLENGTERLRIFLRTSQANREPKADMDMRLLNGNGDVVYDASSPFVNETLVLWKGNLDALAHPGPYTVRCDLYSGSSYSGLLEVAMEHPSEIEPTATPAQSATATSTSGAAP